MNEDNLDTQYVQQLLLSANSLASSTPDLSKDEGTRSRLLGLCQQLTGILQQPDENVAYLAHSGGRLLCVRVAIDLGLFRLICDRPYTSAELSSTTGAEEQLIVRVMRMLVAIGFATRHRDGRYGATSTSKQMTLPSVQAGVKLNFDETLDILTCTPAYLKQNGYRLPRTMTDTPFQFARQTHFDNHQYWAQERPYVMDYLQTFLKGIYGGPARAPWWRWYPIEETLNTNAEVAFVDVAGGRGHEAESALKACPNVKGRFVLQDLPEVIDGIAQLDTRIERLPHDFLQPQPESVKGARVFFLANILHDHPDSTCRTILENIKPAMDPLQSKLLISNFIVSEDNPSLHQLDMDMSMFFLSGGRQRTESEWTELLGPAGFEINKFWHPPGDQNGIVEASLQNHA